MDNENKFPLVSFVLLAYISEKFIKSAVEAALSQEYPNLEVILSDDHSSDKTFEIMNEVALSYIGPHRIILNRNDCNMGIREHCNKLLYELSNGDIILLAAGDDISMPDRTINSVDFFLSHPEVSSLSFESQLIDEFGRKIVSPLLNISSNAKTSIYTLTDYVKFDFFIYSGESRALRRSVIDKFPPLKYSNSEDIFLFIRSLYVGSIAYIRKPCVLYRQHSNSVMAKCRARKKLKKEELLKFERTTKKQLYADYDYAVEHNYISEIDKIRVRAKISEAVLWLKPKQYSFFHRACRLIFRSLSSISNDIAKKI